MVWRSDRVIISLLSGSVFAAWIPIYLRYQTALQSVPFIDLLSILLGLPGFLSRRFSQIIRTLRCGLCHWRPSFSIRSSFTWAMS